MPHTAWEGPERRRNKATINDPIKDHFDKRFDDLEALIRSGFPDGDIDGHRRAHEQVIKAAESRAKLWNAAAEAVIKSGVVGAALLLVTVLWQAFKDRVKG